ncbi:MAG: MATE family efflux transporter [Clostridia bacterium]|nr:MATE family efflux transporter [Clostridia bacterium]
MNEEINIKKQLKISVPIAFESLINILMTLVDTLVISVIGTTELAALGAMSVIINIMQMSIQTMNVSNNTLVAKAIGEKDENKIKLTTGNSIFITILISIITIIIIYIIKPVFPNLFEVDEICNIYLTIRLIGFIQSSIVTVLSGHQRTIGNQGNILVLRIFAVVLNLILDLIAVKQGYGIKGVAWVTVFIDTILAIYLLIKSKNTIKYKLNKIYFKEIFKLFKWNFIERIASRVDNFIFNLIVAKMGNLEYAVHVILIQIANIYEAFIQGFGDGITISIGIASGNNKENSMKKVKEVAKKLINICAFIFPIIVFIIAIIVMRISLQEKELQNIFYSILPLLVIGTYVTMSATYYFAILRGIRDFKFLAKRNIISSISKIILAIFLAFTPLGIVGVWIAYLAYGLIQKYLSKNRYNQIFNKKT